MEERGEGMFQQVVRGLALIGLVGGLACGPDLPEPAAEASSTASEQSLEPDPVEKRLGFRLRRDLKGLLLNLQLLFGVPAVRRDCNLTQRCDSVPPLT